MSLFHWHEWFLTLLYEILNKVVSVVRQRAAAVLVGLSQGPETVKVFGDPLLIAGFSLAVTADLEGFNGSVEESGEDLLD